MTTLIICRHFDPLHTLHGCKVGRIAYVDCGPGCAWHDADPEPEGRSKTDREYWYAGLQHATDRGSTDG